MIKKLLRVRHFPVCFLCSAGAILWCHHEKKMAHVFGSVTTDAIHLISSNKQNISVKGSASIQNRVETVYWLIVLWCSECSITVSETGKMLLSA